MTIRKRKSEVSHHDGKVTIRYTAGFKLPYKIQFASQNAELSVEMTGDDEERLMGEVEEFVWRHLSRMIDVAQEKGPAIEGRVVRKSSRKQGNRE